MKKVFVNQKGFWGDIVFIMAILQKYVKDGYEVFFPLQVEYFGPPSIQDYFPMIKFEGGVRNEGDEIIDLNFHVIYSKHPKCPGHMRFKYEDLDFPLDMWRDVIIERKYEVEEKLFETLGLSDGKKYNFINENWHKAGNDKLTIETGNDYPNIEMRRIDGFSLFDWITVMQRAQSIHTVSTSINFFIDLYDMPADLHMYRRGTSTNHDEYDFLFNKNYIWH